MSLIKISSTLIISSFLFASCQNIENMDNMESSTQTMNQEEQSQNSTEVMVKTGKFEGMSIEGLQYRSGEQSGLTNDMGEFMYEEGKQVTFLIANQPLVSLDSTLAVNYLPSSGSLENESVELINFWRFLISLDKDGDLENGIYIDPAIHELSWGAFDLQSEGFEMQANTFVNANNGHYQQLISQQQTIEQLNIQMYDGFACGASHEKVGQTMTFSTKYHDVAGQAEIINDCTIRITNFTFDGQGPAVYFYTGQNGDFSSGEILGEKLTTAFDNEVVDIPVANLDDFDSLSVWCLQFGISFGDGIFSFE